MALSSAGMSLSSCSNPGKGDDRMSKTSASIIEGWPDNESGIEAGVSAPFAGMAGEQAVMVGGCNFPQANPLAPDAIKKYYTGIYSVTINGDSLEWNHIGELPSPIAYGVSVSTPHGLLMAGGQTPDGSSNETRLLKIDKNGALEIENLAPLPEPIDNAYAAGERDSVFVVGGALSGNPSNKVFMYSLESDTWSELPPMPGNPRVQPVAAVSGGKLYVWGGFAGRTENSEPTFETGGLCYEPVTGVWTEIAPAKDKDGYLCGLGGGAVVTLSDGRILAAGGVNPEVFLNAIRKTPEGYLNHEPEWYRFNKAILVYDPRTDNWEEILRTPDAARAGAAMINLPGDEILMLGGEIKPRIRNPHTLRISL